MNVTLTERAVVDDERVLELRIDRAARGELRLGRYAAPRIAVSAAQVAVWGGTRLYLTPLADGAPTRVEPGDEIQAAYPLGARWLLVCELSLVLLDQARGAELGRYEHDAVLLRHRWAGDRLLVEDFRGRRLAFRPLAPEGDLAPDAGA